MNETLLQILACPHCQGSLTLQEDELGENRFVKRGRLACNDCRRTFPIEDDIPYFCSSVIHRGIRNQRQTYSTWWDKYHDESTIIDPQWRGFFFNSLRIPASDFEGAVVLDAGCGNGRFSYLVSHYHPKLLISFDIGTGLQHARRTIEKRSPDAASVAYVQGDITKPPFKRRVFDIVFSWGVIHHTPDTRKTFGIISDLAREGGQLGVFVYEFHPLYRSDRQWLSFAAYLRSLFLVRPLRFLCSRLPIALVQALFIPIYALERALNFGFMGCHRSGNDKWNYQAYRKVVVDRFKTRYASEHQLEEVLGWFKETGFNDLRVGHGPRVSVTGVKERGEGRGSLRVNMISSNEVDHSIPKDLQGQVLKRAG